jgi:ribonuclease R
MHRLGDVVEVRLVEAAPVAGALRFELLSDGQVAPRGGRKHESRGPKSKASVKARPGRDTKSKKKSRKPSRKERKAKKKG